MIKFDMVQFLNLLYEDALVDVKFSRDPSSSDIEKMVMKIAEAHISDLSKELKKIASRNKKIVASMVEETLITGQRPPSSNWKNASYDRRGL